MAKNTRVADNYNEDATFRKISWRLLPFLFLCYVMAQIDRFNISFAKLQFLQDLHLDDQAFGFAAGILTVGYVAFEIPSNVWLERIGARRTISRIMVLWGAVTALMMFTSTAWHLYALRFLLGAAEAGFLPGLIYYLSLWYPERRLGSATSWVLIAIPMAGVLNGPLSGWIMSDLEGTLGFHGWQWLFLLTGLPAIVCGIVAFVWLSDRPSDVTWLSPEEKSRIDAKPRRAPEHVRRQLAALLRHPSFYVLLFSYFTIFVSLNTIILWQPTIVKAIPGESIRSVGWIIGFASLVAAAGTVAVSYASDYFRERRWHILACGLIAGIAMILLPRLNSSVVVTIVLLCAASIGIFSSTSLFWTLSRSFLGENVRAVAIAAISSVGATGGFFSPILVGWLKVTTGNFAIAFGVVGVLLMLGMALLIIVFGRNGSRWGDQTIGAPKVGFASPSLPPGAAQGG